MAAIPDMASLASAALASSPQLREQFEKVGGQALLDKLVPQSDAPSRAPHFAPTGPSALFCATRYCFAVDDLKAPDPDIGGLVAASAAVVVGGMTRLRLGDEERATILDASLGGAALTELLIGSADKDAATLTGDDADSDVMISAWIRTFLRGADVPWPRQSAKRLSAAYAARMTLQKVSRLGTGVPSAGDLKRRLDMAELLEPLRIIVGLGDPADILRKDRFAGRADELRQLRAFVDELDAKGTLEAVGRTFSRVQRGIAQGLGDVRARMLMLSAPGGLGKSTLIAKFVLDHALGKRNFPFAYLDFDRSTLQPRSPEQLLIETARQVAIVYPEIAVPLGDVRNRLRQGLVDGDRDLFVDLCAEFRSIVQRAIYENPANTFLLVLDTIEIAQADSLAVQGITRFLSTLVEVGFPELVIVVSGRREVPEFDDSERWAITRLELKPLTTRDAVLMVDLLGESLAEKWPHDWSVKIAGGPNDPPIRREPLTLRVAVEIVRNAEPARRALLVEEIATLGVAADKTFVGRLYEKRVLDHVGDPRAKKLAWPGLVVRRITQDIAVNVLAPICDLTADEAYWAYNQLAKEGWIVDRDGDGLRHRADLRSRTLPLMRLHDRPKFEDLASTMVDYFSGRGAKEPGASSEAIYYRLLRGDDPTFLDEAWFTELETTLGAAIEDFDGEGAAVRYITARLSPRLLSRTALARVTDASAWEHVARVGSSLRSLDDDAIDPRVVDLVRRAEKRDSASIAPLTEAAQAARQSIVIKAGAWDILEPEKLILPDSHIDLIPETLFSSLLLATNTTSPAAWLTPNRYDQLTRRRSLESWPVLAFSLLPALMVHGPLYRELDRQLADVLETRSGSGRMPAGALRAAMMLGTECLPAALRTFVEGVQSNMTLQGRRGPRVAPAMSLSELTVLTSELFPDSSLKSALAGYPRAYVNASAPARIDDPEIIGIALQVLATLGDGLDGMAYAKAVRAFAAARLEGWSAVVGYALVREAPFEQWVRILGQNRAWFGDHPTDAIQLALFAEQGGALPALLKEATDFPSAHGRLRRVSGTILAWQDQSRRLAETLGPVPPRPLP